MIKKGWNFNNFLVGFEQNDIGKISKPNTCTGNMYFCFEISQAFIISFGHNQINLSSDIKNLSKDSNIIPAFALMCRQKNTVFTCIQ